MWTNENGTGLNKVLQIMTHRLLATPKNISNILHNMAQPNARVK